MFACYRAAAVAAAAARPLCHPRPCARPDSQPPPHCRPQVGPVPEAEAHAFGLPAWCAKCGMQPGAEFTMGVIVRGDQPAAFMVQLADPAGGDE